MVHEFIMRGVVAIVALSLGSSCGALCAQRLPLTASDGGQRSCVQTGNCIGPSNVLECAATEDQVRDCVACENTLCVRYQPGACTR